MLQSFLEECIKREVKKHYDISLDEISLDKPPKKELGDFAFGAFILSKDLKKNPVKIAGILAQFLSESEGIEKAEALGPYVNITLKKDIVSKSFDEFYNAFFRNSLFSKKDIHIYVDYIGANIGKPLHIGHMCTPNIGQTMINLNRKLGYNVVSDSHLGDWGIIFGKLIYAYKRWGEEEKLKENAVDYLLELYIQVSAEEGTEDEYRAEFRKLASGDKESMELWKKFTSHSITAMNTSLARINVQSDYNIGESFYEGIGLPKIEDIPDLQYSMTDIVEELINKNIGIVNDDNSVGVEFDENTKITSCILRKRDGAHGYLASDLAAIKYRIEEFNAQRIIYYVDERQSLHFKQAFNIAKRAGWLDSGVELIHAPNGFVKLKDGAMSTRSGRIIRLEALLDEAHKRAKAIIEEKGVDIHGEELENLAEIIGIGAIKYAYLKKSRENDVVFDWDEFMSFDGNNAPYIQYSYVRANNILHKYFGDKSIDFNVFDTIIGDKNVVFNYDEELQLVQKLLIYSQILEETSEKNMPHILCRYTYELTKVFSNFYTNVHILNEADEERKVLRLKLIYLYAKIIEELFSMLAIDLPKRM